MKTMLKRFVDDEVGLILSAEVVLILTIGVLAVVVGLNAVAKAVNHELFDVAGAIGAIDQSYVVSGFANSHGNAWFGGNGYMGGGFGYIDRADECDCASMISRHGAYRGQSCGYVSRGYSSGRTVAPVTPAAPCIDCVEDDCVDCVEPGAAVIEDEPCYDCPIKCEGCSPDGRPLPLEIEPESDPASETPAPEPADEAAPEPPAANE
ncbi:hypothetical protein [Calycomorphotria hydatis]|uniref:Uncharacterized protein n=1 Tax=Calycomorphotria hydatis TaxID=2528027 RepID=A0A517T8F6_9PLAN|nr:hypothetical protein [Calycomorphotria hydatis]QDT64661.1 hypothetical protein V22_19010 [Calycomorphotria hydatis]